MKRTIIAALLIACGFVAGVACELETFCCDTNADGIGDRTVYPGCEQASGQYITTTCG